MLHNTHNNDGGQLKAWPTTYRFLTSYGLLDQQIDKASNTFQLDFRGGLQANAQHKATKTSAET